MKNKSTAGGSRPGAGRPKGEKKKAIGLRVPVKHHKRLSDMIRKELLLLKNT